MKSGNKSSIKISLIHVFERIQPDYDKRVKTKGRCIGRWLSLMGEYVTSWGGYVEEWKENQYYYLSLIFKWLMGIFLE